MRSLAITANQTLEADGEETRPLRTRRNTMTRRAGMADCTMATPLITGVDIHSSEPSQGLDVGLKTLFVLQNTLGCPSAIASRDKGFLSVGLFLFSGRNIH